jgi:Holliday junction resolvasome RuvABC endonuclease subunit
VWNIQNCEFLFFEYKARADEMLGYQLKFDRHWHLINTLIVLNKQQKVKGPQVQRFIDLTTVLLPDSNDGSNIELYAEGYSFGSKGMVFNIAEAMGMYKYRLFMQTGQHVRLVAPSTVKKYATTKGNAKKPQMVESFIAETGVLLHDILGKRSLTVSPISDIVDSYYICKYGFEHGRNTTI